ncbi:hypothetical protein [Brevundimonas sp. Root1279]|uniref:hypothetical protein n=1 Tax=Brevundimonas sp. Root1279 TaxID=1736443 RepID=UPI00071602B5|nr:hypothetical protein [Brevundimonas sp. Root1279]KQW86702.1 hypothetical protein ASC65_02110 [Brevundimonas sp. Root1279]
MRKLYNAAILGAAVMMTAASASQAPVQRNSLCYLECQYRCYATNPGGGAAWQACYLQCARDRCGAVGV